MKNKKIDQWKKEYSEIPVPQEAQFRIRQGIKQAKTDSYQRNIGRFLRNTGTVAAAAMVILMVVVNTNETLAKSLGEVPMLGGIAKIVTWRTYEDQTNHFEAKVEVPKIQVEPSKGGIAPDAQVTENYELSNAQIEAYASQFITEYEKQIKDSEGQGNYGLDSSYTVVGNHERYLSLRIDTTVVMASGTQYVKIFNIDKATGTIITLSSLFKDEKNALAAISENIKGQMKAQMEADTGVMYFYNSEMPEDDFKGLTGEESFYFNEGGEIVICFQEYEVAPGSMGAVEFTIPKSVTDAYR